MTTEIAAAPVLRMTAPLSRTTERAATRWGLIFLAVLVAGLVLELPLAAVLVQATVGPAVVRHMTSFGPLARVTVALAGVSLDAALPAEAWTRLGLAVGDRVAVAARLGTVFARPSGAGVGLLPLAGGLMLVPGPAASREESRPG